ncbi:hypothetical protein WA026_020174 [Henosepilachna vigintioctopunctata]|uniref:t-SNARE coiled-coil homology domain-containing protein n=1 Tax=Henosepilachna vigintioctopunctata TaxID=420089 RepID=A0AAW1U4R5_9CUCU
MESLSKQPLKVLQIPLSKISEEVIPYYQSRYDKQRVTFTKLLTEKNAKEIQKETLIIRRTIVQLEDLIHELDHLKLQVKDSDIEKYNISAIPLHKSIIKLICRFKDLSQLQHRLDSTEYNKQGETITNLLEGSCKQLVSENLEDLKLQEYTAIGTKVDGLQDEINDIHDIFTELNGMIVVQGESVQSAFESVESTSNNVNRGFQNLQTAVRLKMATYPLTGAVLGGMLGGPIGIVAGAKIGGLASLCGCIAGYTGLKALKNSKCNTN